MLRRLFPFLLAAIFVAPAAAQEAATPWIGISIEAGSRGVIVKDVIEHTPAERAGLAAGDEVLSIDGVAVSKPQDLIARVQAKGIGEKVSLVVARHNGGGEATLTMALEARPNEVKLLQDHLMNKPAPPYNLTDLNNKASLLSDLNGKVVVLEFWATWCGPCNSSLPRLMDWQAKYGDKGLRVVGISTEPPATISRHATDKKINYTLLPDPKGVTTSAYQVPAIPTIVVIDRNGKVRYADVGAGGKLDLVEAAFTPLLDSATKR